MPTVSADQVRFFSALDIPGLSIEKFSEMCFDFGVELDDVTSEQQQAQKEHEGRVNATTARLSDRTILKIDVSANRYDLMCEEGLARAFRVFLGKEKNPRFTSILPTNPITITVKKEVRHKSSSHRTTHVSPVRTNPTVHCGRRSSWH